jgi:hypothetical protein
MLISFARVRFIGIISVIGVIGFVASRRGFDPHPKQATYHTRRALAAS